MTLARLDFFTGALRRDARDWSRSTRPMPARGRHLARRCRSPRPAARHGGWTTGSARWGDVTVATVGDVMALYGQAEPRAVGARMAQMMVRGASRLRAAGGPADLRRATPARRCRGVGAAPALCQFFAVEEYDLRFRRFDGSMSAEVNRAVFISGDAVTVLPYDPVRDRVLLIEQFRVGPLARGDDQPWLLEAIAGPYRPGRNPGRGRPARGAWRRRGWTWASCSPIGSYYPSPGAKAEYLYSYVALVDLPDGAAGTFGLADEAEDIRGHLVAFDRLMDLVASGEVDNAPLLVSVLWLAARAVAACGRDRHSR